MTSDFWASFSNELQKLAAKSPTGLKVPLPGTNLKGFERVTGNPGKTPTTAPGKGSLANTAGMGQSLPVGRSGTSAISSPQPPSIR